MLKHSRITLVAVCAAILITPNGALAKGPKENADAIDRWLETTVPKGFRGQVLLERDGQVVLDRAYGVANEASGVAAKTDTLYYIGSLAKMFTSAVILQLKAQKKLKLSDPIGRHLDGVPRDKARVTIKQLLSHTSGAAANHPDPFSKLDRDSFIEWFLATPLEHRPGKKHQYSNVAYSVLAAIIERVDGGSFQDSVRRRVFVPAGMKDTFFLDEISPHLDRLAVGSGEKVIEHGLDGKVESYAGTWLRLGPGGIVSTARDLLKWDQALRAETVLDAAQYRLATTPNKPREPWGLGWRLSRTTRKTPLHYHDGGLPGFNSLFARFPYENAVVIILCNRDEAAGNVGKRVVKDFFLE